MRNANEIAKYLEQRIGHIYDRPLMYGGSAEGVDLIIYYWHEIWAMVHCRDGDFRRIFEEVHEVEGCIGANFASHYRRDKPKASDQETVVYVVAQWKKISSRLGISL